MNTLWANAGNRPKVAIVILTWNGLSDTLECLASIRQIRGKPADIPEPCPFMVIVVDNGSTDQTAIVIAADHPEVQVLRQDTNLGFAEGNNRGAKLALALGARYIFFLNNDAKIESHCLERLIDLLEREPGLGIVGPLTYRGESADLVPSAHRVNLWTGAVRNIQLTDQNETEWIEADYVWGCGLFIRADLWQDLGGFDRRYFAYFEDADLCLRAKALGHITAVATGAKIRHKVSKTGNRIFWRQTWLRARNYYRFLAAHGTFSQRVMALPVYFVYRLPRFLYESVRVYAGLRRRGRLQRKAT